MVILLKVALMKFNEKLLSGSGVITHGRTDRQTGFTKPTDPISAAFSCRRISRKTSQIVLPSLKSSQEGTVYRNAHRQNGHSTAEIRPKRLIPLCSLSVLCLCEMCLYW